jgi:dihydroneopterin aldolase
VSATITICLDLRDIEVALAVGVTAAERAAPQKLRISLRALLETASNAPVLDSDALDDTLDYDRLIAFLERELPAAGPYHLIEALADRICRMCLAQSPRVIEAQTTIAKPSVRAGRSGEVSVTVRRLREGGA